MLCATAVAGSITRLFCIVDLAKKKKANTGKAVLILPTLWIGVEGTCDRTPSANYCWLGFVRHWAVVISFAGTIEERLATVAWLWTCTGELEFAGLIQATDLTGVKYKKKDGKKKEAHVYLWTDRLGSGTSANSCYFASSLTVADDLSSSCGFACLQR